MTFGAGFGFPRARFPMGAAPTLNMDFAGTAALPPYVTFSRGTNATYVDSLGNIAYAPSNLLTYSEQFDNAAWVKSNTVITANATIAPDGTITADTITDTVDAVSTAHQVSRNVTVTAGEIYTLSIYARSGTGSGVSIGALLGVFPVEQRVFYNTNTGVPTTQLGTPGNVVMAPIGNGWYRCSLSLNVPTSGTMHIMYRLYNFAGAGFYVGDGTQTVFIWGAQLNLDGLQPYNSTTVKNLLGYTQDFDNAAWTKSNSSITQNVIAAPDGSLTADKAVGSAAVAPTILQPTPVNAGTVYTYSVYVKAAELGFVRLQAQGAANTAAAIVVNLSTLAISSTVGAPLNARAVPVGNDFVRISFGLAATTSANAALAVYLCNDASGVYTGDGTSGIYIWGAQLSDSASLDPYSYNFTTAPTAAAYYGPRFDYDPVTLACKGLLIEEQRTNSIRNNTMQGAVAPSTFPTNWQNVAAFAGLTTTVIGSGVADGITYLDVRVNGTPTISTYYNLVPDILVAAASGQTWTGSFWASLVAGSLTNTNANIEIRESDVAQAFLANSIALLPLTSTLTRYSQTKALNNAATAFVSVRFVWQITNGLPVDFTLRIGLPQLELGAFATSVIPTTTTAVTRAADVAVIQGANFSNWYNQSEGTLYAELRPNNFEQVGGDQGVFTVDDGNFARGYAVAARTNVIRFIRRDASNSIGTSISYTGSTAKAATTLYSFSAQRAVNGGAVNVDPTVLSLNPMTTLRIGFNNIVGITALNYLNGHIARIAYYPTRQPNATLQAITT